MCCYTFPRLIELQTQTARLYRGFPSNCDQQAPGPGRRAPRLSCPNQPTLRPHRVEEASPPHLSRHRARQPSSPLLWRPDTSRPQTRTTAPLKQPACTRERQCSRHSQERFRPQWMAAVSPPSSLRGQCLPHPLSPPGLYCHPIKPERVAGVSFPSSLPGQCLPHPPCRLGLCCYPCRSPPLPCQLARWAPDPHTV